VIFLFFFLMIMTSLLYATDAAGHDTVMLVKGRPFATHDFVVTVGACFHAVISLFRLTFPSS
jgi:hypothetical protein